MVTWYAGVPWLEDALAVAEVDDAAGPVSEVARQFIESCQGDPTRTPEPGTPTAVQRGEWVAVVSADLVVVGHGRGAAVGHPTPISFPKPAGRTRGPRDYDELVEWLADEGYAVVATGGQHRAVINQKGQRLVTLSSSPSDGKRSLANDVAECRRALGLELRRPHR